MSDDNGAGGGKPRSQRMLDAVERAGNKLPDPVTLFFLLVLAVMLASWLAAASGVSAAHPVSGEALKAVNLFSAEMLRKLFVEMPETFAGFPPLGTVLVAMLGVGVAEKSGLIGAGLSAFVRRVPDRLLAPALVFAGVMSSLAVDAGYVVLVPLGGVLFLGAGRHPIAGIAAAFAGVSAGFSANLLVTPLDALLAGISTTAAQIVDADYTVPITANYYLMVVLVFVFTALGAWITERVIEPRLGTFEGRAEREDELSADQAGRGLRYTAIALGLFIALVLALTVPDGAALYDPEAGPQPFLNSLVALLFLGFLMLGIAFGIGAGTISSDRDAVQMMAKSMSDMGLYVVLAFVIAHFIALFKWSNLGLLAAIGGAEGLRALGLPGPVLAVGVVLLAGLLNIFVGSASAKWALIGPVFVPMLMLLGLSPEFTQAAYRMGDAFTNIITPLMPYFPMVIVFAQRYAGEFGIGSLVATMLPYSLAFGIGSTLILLIWMLAGLPLGPGSGVTVAAPG